MAILSHNLYRSFPGTTLANLKKQRAQSRSCSVGGAASNPLSLENGSVSIAMQTMNSCNSLVDSNPQSLELSMTNSEMELAEVTKFSGITGDVVSDTTRSRRCCIVMWIVSKKSSYRIPNILYCIILFCSPTNDQAGQPNLSKYSRTFSRHIQTSF